MKKSVVIIGAGLAGVTLANKLSTFFNVSVIEKGPSNKGIVDSNKLSKLAYVPTFSYGHGGSTNIWHNGLIKSKMEEVSSYYFKKKLESLNDFYDEAAKNLFFNSTVGFSKFIDDLLERK